MSRAIPAEPALGLHLGHNAACAIAEGNEIKAGIQLERVSRRKHDGVGWLSKRLPISQVLRSAGCRIGDVGVVVSSFQAAAPGGAHFGAGYVAPNFDCFNANDPRHWVISHHFAHAYMTAAESGFDECAVLVCDLGGSTTLDGLDYDLPFSEWDNSFKCLAGRETAKTECLSIYKWSKGRLDLLDREYVIPHCAPSVFICSVASLFENTSTAIFKGKAAYGELMALASFGDIRQSPIEIADVLEIAGENVTWKNGWQRKLDFNIDDFERAAAVASVVQRVTELALSTYAVRALSMAQSSSLAVAGGVFLNIGSNSRLALKCERFFVPSAPHDAGISHGCALYGLTKLGQSTSVPFKSYQNDRIGFANSQNGEELDLTGFEDLVTLHRYNREQVARSLMAGKVVARCCGRSEFGPRALGGRSLLASPFLASSKDLLNKIKSRQVWRPVAPITLSERMNDFFEGPKQSPFMHFLHRIQPDWSKQFEALAHADGSTRAQSLKREDDPELYYLLKKFGRLTGAPVLVNTSLNGRDEPIVESVSDALRFFLRHSEIDSLILDNCTIRRSGPWASAALMEKSVQLSVETKVFLASGGSDFCAVISQRGQEFEIDIELAIVLLSIGPLQQVSSILDRVGGRESHLARQLYTLLETGCLEVIRS